MPHIELYKYSYQLVINPGSDPEDVEFNYFDVGFEGLTGGVQCVDSMLIEDILPESLTGIDWGVRKQDDIKLIDCGRFAQMIERANDARSEEGKSIDEFLATSELNFRQIYCVYQYGPDIAYEGWLDTQALMRDSTWTEKKWDLDFEIDGPMGKFLDSAKEQNVEKIPATGRIDYMSYFRDYHFAHWFNNGTVPAYADDIKLKDKLGWEAEPIISNPLQRSILLTDMSVYDATKSFVIGLGFAFELVSIRPMGYEPYHRLPFKMHIKLEGDAENAETVEDLLVHKQGYSWSGNKHFIIPYWKLSGQPPQMEAYYHGLFMSANARRIENHDLWGGYPIEHYNAGARKNMYFITAGNYGAWVKDTYLLDLEYREHGLFTVNVLGEDFGIGMAYCRILIRRHFKISLIYRDEGFEDIVRVTAEKVYPYMCGQFKERLFVTVPYPPDTKIKPGSVLSVTAAGRDYKVDKIKKIEVKKQQADMELMEK